MNRKTLKILLSFIAVCAVLISMLIYIKYPWSLEIEKFLYTPNMLRMKKPNHNGAGE